MNYQSHEEMVELCEKRAGFRVQYNGQWYLKLEDVPEANFTGMYVNMTDGLLTHGSFLRGAYNAAV